MAFLKFDNFVFDSERFQLKRQGQLVSLRPKVLQLLSLLIANRERVVPKNEIFSTIWGSAYARDHLLFQLISELRKPPFSADFVRTLPNQGYQWNVSTEIAPNTSSRPFKIAASIVFAMMCAVSPFYLSSNGSSENKAVKMPALSAFSKGVVAMESGESRQAVEWFTFALNENPDSVESRLFLAEALLQQNKSEESSEHLYALLLKPNLDSYNKISATDLLSRIRQKQGRLIDALRYAQESSKSDVVAQCTVEVVAGRVESLKDTLGVSLASSSVSQNEPISDKEETQKHRDQCQKLKLESDQTSYCSPNGETDWIAYKSNDQMYFTS